MRGRTNKKKIGNAERLPIIQKFHSQYREDVTSKDPPIRNLTKIRLISFLHEGTIFKKNQPEDSYKVFSFFVGSYCL